MRLACAALAALVFATPSLAAAQAGQMPRDPRLPTLQRVPQVNAARPPVIVLDETAVRAFVARQERAWNAGQVDRYFAAYAPGAVFIDQARTGKGEIVPYGKATLPQARAQARRFFAKAKVTETGTIQSIRLSAGGRAITVFSNAISRTTRGGKTETSCILRQQTLVMTGGHLTSSGQTDTLFRCPR